MEEVRNEGIEEGIKEEIIKGAKEKSYNVAKELILDGYMSFERIAQITKLSIEEVKKLTKQN